MKKPDATRNLFLTELTFALVLASAPAAMQSTVPGNCKARIERHPFPGLRILQISSGYSGSGGTYDETQLLVPEPVPLMLEYEDEDTVIGWCGVEGRSEVFRAETYGAEWTISTAGSSDQVGGFLDPNGTLVDPKVAFGTGVDIRGCGTGALDDRLIGYDAVLYVPPRNLAPGETRVISITAEIQDLCAFRGQPDGPAIVPFDVTVTRSAGSPSLFDVRVDVDTQGIIQPDPSQPSVNDPPGGCLMSGPTITQGGPILPAFKGFPNHMLTDEVRPIRVDILNCDTVQVFCESPTGQVSSATRSIRVETTVVWSLQAPEGGQFLFGVGNTGLYRAGPDPSRDIPLVTVAADLDLGFTFAPISDTIDSYRMRFIDQNNDPLALLPIRSLGESTSLSEGLTVSRKTISDFDDMNGCPGPSNDFDGPVPPAPDPNTFRIEIEQAPGQPVPFNIVLEVHDSDGVRSSNDHAPISLDLFTWRSDLHVRLVSNARPDENSNLPGAYEYDDEACDDPLMDQSVVARPGDWVRAHLFLGPVGVVPATGTIELPVGRPWAEAGSDLTILTADVDVFALAGIDGTTEGAASFRGSPDTTHASWEDAGAFLVERMAEDWAPANIRFEKPDPVAEGGPFSNALLLRDDGGAPSHNPGILSIGVGPPGPVLPIVSLQLLGNESTSTVATMIQSAVQSQLPSVSVDIVNNALPPEEGLLLVFDRGQERDLVISTAGTQLDLEIAPQDWTDGLVTFLEANLLGFNLRSNQGPLQASIETIVFPPTDFFVPGQRGAVATQDNGDWMLAPGMFYGVFLTEAGGNGWDGDFPELAGHELGHLFRDSGQEDPGTNYLMNATEVGETGGGIGTEMPDVGKRLRDSTASEARTSPILELRPILIPPARNAP